MDGKLSSFGLDFAGIVSVDFEKLTFHAERGRQMAVGAVVQGIAFKGSLTFVDELRNILPSTGFSNAPTLSAGPQGVTVGYGLGIPSVGVGIFSLQNINLSASLSLPFVEQPAAVRFAISKRDHPFIVTVGIFGGGGYFALEVSTDGHTLVEGALEFGGNVALDLLVASGGVHLMAGIYFKLGAGTVELSGFLRCGGYLEVLGIISLSVEFYMELKYVDDATAHNKVIGTATLSVSAHVLFFSTSVELSVHKEFAGSGADPTFDDVVNPDQWRQYCQAFA